MNGVSACRKCRTELRGSTYLQLGATLEGSNKLCVSCVERYMERGGFKKLRDFVENFISENKRDTVRTLKKEVEELRRLLDVLTTPEGK